MRNLLVNNGTINIAAIYAIGSMIAMISKVNLSVYFMSFSYIFSKRTAPNLKIIIK
jgi:hypothetical protein